MAHAPDDHPPPAIAATPLIERIARVLAAQHLSANAQGTETSAAGAVDIEWQDFIEPATAVLKVLREPDLSMVQEGDAAIWHRMVSIALEQADQFH